MYRIAREPRPRGEVGGEKPPHPPERATQQKTRTRFLTLVSRSLAVASRQAKRPHHRVRVTEVGYRRLATEERSAPHVLPLALRLHAAPRPRTHLWVRGEGAGARRREGPRDARREARHR